MTSISTDDDNHDANLVRSTIARWLWPLCTIMKHALPRVSRSILNLLENFFHAVQFKTELRLYFYEKKNILLLIFLYMNVFKVLQFQFYNITTIIYNLGFLKVIQTFRCNNISPYNLNLVSIMLFSAVLPQIFLHDQSILFCYSS